MATSGINFFVDAPRSSVVFKEKTARAVYFSGIRQSVDGHTFSYYLADKAPSYYRRLEDVIDTIKDGNLLSAVADTLRRIPQASTFQESHAGEIIASLFAQEHLQLVQVYSKLRLLTAQNANAFKMDLVFCDPSTDPVTFIMGEVKSSMKKAVSGAAAGHDVSCYSEIFRSLNEYTKEDLEYDLTAARDELKSMEPEIAEKIRSALKPYTKRSVQYAAFAIIDRATFSETEARVLATRKNEKALVVDVIGIDELHLVTANAFAKLNELLKKCSG